MKISFFRLVTIFFLISFFAAPSFALLRDKEETINRELPANYTAILIQLPGVTHQPLVWNDKFSMPMKNVVLPSAEELASKGLSAEKTTALNGLSVEDIALQFNGKVFFSNPDYSYAYIYVPDESYGNMTESLKLIGFDVKNASWGKAMMNESRQEVGLPYSNLRTKLAVTGKGRKIAIIDTGLDGNHTDFYDSNGNQPLNNKVIYWNDIINKTQCCIDLLGHGTHVASIAAGTGANSSGLYAGIAPDAQLIILRISMEGEALLGHLASAINDAVGQSPDVISVSFGWNEGEISLYDTSMADACVGIGTQDVTDVFNSIQNATNHGIPVVFSAGNDGPSPGSINFPACILDVIAVGQTYKRDYENNTFELYVYDIDRIEDAKVHIMANEGFDKEWNAFSTGTGIDRFWTWSGFLKVFNSNNPTIDLKMEAVHKSKNCWESDKTTWNPGNSSKGDSFWAWTTSASPYGGMEVYGKVHTSFGWCIPNIGVDVFGTTYVNSFPCSGTPIACNNMGKYSCQNQAGCCWCGCRLPDLIGTCVDVPEVVCGMPPTNGAWVGCEGTAKPCADRSNKEGECGTTSTTGCSGQWILDDVNVRLFSTAKPSLKGLPTIKSSRGPSPNGFIKPDVTAPGYDVCAAKASGTGDSSEMTCGNDNYIRYSGTSMAAPVVAGMIALLKEINPSASYNDAVSSIKTGDILVNYSLGEVSEYNRGYGRVNISKAGCVILKGGGYKDDDLLKCSGYDYTYSSANQIRSGYHLNNGGGCDCNVSFDSYIANIAVNNINTGDSEVYSNDKISVDVDVRNTGSYQSWWYLGVEFWNVSDYNDPWHTRDHKGRINAFYNGKAGTHGCVLNPDPINAPEGGQCPAGVDCSIISESVNANGKLDVGEIIRVRCQAPASFYKSTTGNQRIMFWVHERDLGQDATNNGDPDKDGIVSEWWTDALAKSFRPGIDNVTDGGPATLRVKINCRTGAEDSDGGKSYTMKGTCTNYYQGGSTCKVAQYTDACASSASLTEYFVSGSTCGSVVKSCNDLGSSYVCSGGACQYVQKATAKSCNTLGGKCMSGSGGCSVACKRLSMSGYCDIGDQSLGYYPGCGAGNCCCFCV